MLQNRTRPLIKDADQRQVQELAGETVGRAVIRTEIDHGFLFRFPAPLEPRMV